MVSSIRVFAVVMMVFEVSNTPMIHREEEEEEDNFTTRTSLAAGRPAELLDNSDINTSTVENVGRPDEVFVHSADIAGHLDCSLETARNELQKLSQAGILKKHGGIETTIKDREVDGNITEQKPHVNLYLPAFDDTKNVMKELYELEDEDPPNFVMATEEVTPSQFDQIEASQVDDSKKQRHFVTDNNSIGTELIDKESWFQYVEDESVIIDVSEPKSGSIQDHVSAQLFEHDLTASSLKNFVYELRQEADLV